MCCISLIVFVVIVHTKNNMQTTLFTLLLSAIELSPHLQAVDTEDCLKLKAKAWLFLMGTFLLAKESTLTN